MPRKQQQTPSDLPSSSSQIAVACKTAQLAEDAHLQGNAEMARRIEDCFIDLLNAMPKSDRFFALMQSFDSLMRDAPPEMPHLRLVHSRD